MTTTARALLSLAIVAGLAFVAMVDRPIHPRPIEGPRYVATIALDAE